MTTTVRRTRARAYKKKLKKQRKKVKKNKGITIEIQSSDDEIKDTHIPSQVEEDLYNPELEEE